MALFPGSTRRPLATALRVNAGHPLAEHLIAAWPCDSGGAVGPGVVRDLVAGVRLSGLSAAVAQTPAGLGLARTGYTPDPFPARLKRTDRVSLFWYGIVVDDGNGLVNNPMWAGVYHNTANNPPYHSYGIFRPNTTDIVFSYNNAGTFGSISAAGSLSSAEYGRPMSFAASYGTDAVRGYKNGRQIASGSGISGITYGTDAQFCLGFNAFLGFSYQTGIATSLVLIFGRVLTPTEQRDLATNPYALFVEPGPRVCLPAVAAETNASVSQLAVEILSQPVPAARVTQAVVELLGATAPPPAASASATQLAVETLQGIPYTFVTQLALELLSPSDPIDTRVTQLALELFRPGLYPARATQLAVEIYHPLLITGRLTQAAVEWLQARPARTRVSHAVVEVWIVPGPGGPSVGGGSCPTPFFDPDTDEDWP